MIARVLAQVQLARREQRLKTAIASVGADSSSTTAVPNPCTSYAERSMPLLMPLPLYAERSSTP
eukprot:11777234-Alexandrium_andersonii.AAC.1